MTDTRQNSMVYEFFDERSAATHRGTGISSNSENQKLVEELHKIITKTFRTT